MNELTLIAILYGIAVLGGECNIHYEKVQNRLSVQFRTDRLYHYCMGRKERGARSRSAHR
jgi:hypothetical protein